MRGGVMMKKKLKKGNLIAIATCEYVYYCRVEKVSKNKALGYSANYFKFDEVQEYKD